MNSWMCLGARILLSVLIGWGISTSSEAEEGKDLPFRRLFIEPYSAYLGNKELVLSGPMAYAFVYENSTGEEAPRVNFDQNQVVAFVRRFTNAPFPQRLELVSVRQLSDRVALDFTIHCSQPADEITLSHFVEIPRRPVLPVELVIRPASGESCVSEEKILIGPEQFRTGLSEDLLP